MNIPEIVIKEVFMQEWLGDTLYGECLENGLAVLVQKGGGKNLFDGKRRFQNSKVLF